MDQFWAGVLAGLVVNVMTSTAAFFVGRWAERRLNPVQWVFELVAGDLWELTRTGKKTALLPTFVMTHDASMPAIPQPVSDSSRPDDMIRGARWQFDKVTVTAPLDLRWVENDKHHSLAFRVLEGQRRLEFHGSDVAVVKQRGYPQR